MSQTTQVQVSFTLDEAKALDDAYSGRIRANVRSLGARDQPCVVCGRGQEDLAIFDGRFRKEAGFAVERFGLARTYRRVSNQRDAA